MQEQSPLDEIQESWEQEIDKYVLKAATEDITEYSQEVRTIIIEEAYQRGFITGEEKNDQRLLIIKGRVWQDKIIERKAKRRRRIGIILSLLGIEPLFLDRLFEIFSFEETNASLRNLQFLITLLGNENS